MTILFALAGVVIGFIVSHFLYLHDMFNMDWKTTQEQFRKQKIFTIVVTLIATIIGFMMDKETIDSGGSLGSLYIVVLILIISIAIIVGWLTIFPEGVTKKIAESQISDKMQKREKLMKDAVDLCNSREAVISRCKTDEDKEIVNHLINELATSYNKWVLEVLGTQEMGKKPLNPYVAAGIGNAVAGVGGAIVMGVAAQNENIQYQERLNEFNKQLASIATAEQKVEYLVNKIHDITR